MFIRLSGWINSMSYKINIKIITLFPEIFESLKYGVTGRAIKNNIVNIEYFNPRSYTENKYGKVDDRSYGGGPGMVMMVDPLQKALQAAKNKTKIKTILLTPQGSLLTHEKIKKLSEEQNIILVCGRYEGIDQRLIDLEIDEELSIGDYVLSGGELAAMVVIDALTRLIPEVLGDETSNQQDSFTDGLLEYPQYTRPEEIHGKKVPSVLLNGNHEEIRLWRLKQSLGKTYLKRPDLLKKRKLTTLETMLLSDFISELNEKKS